MKFAVGFWVTVFILTSLNSIAGTEVGNGGDEYAIAFVEVGEQVANWLDENGLALKHPVRSFEFRKVLRAAKIESTDQSLTLDGVQKDAINYPASQRILINRSAWDRIKSVIRKKALVFHEILGLLGIPDTNYENSDSILKTVAAYERKMSCEAIFSFFNLKLKANDIDHCVNSYFGRLMENDIEEGSPKILFFGAPKPHSKWQTCLIELKKSSQMSAEVVNCAAASNREE